MPHKCNTCWKGQAYRRLRYACDNSACEFFHEAAVEESLRLHHVAQESWPWSESWNSAQQPNRRRRRQWHQRKQWNDWDWQRAAANDNHDAGPGGHDEVATWQE
eukprot:7986465-Alexandrium_andersonii.AAC.1